MSAERDKLAERAFPLRVDGPDWMDVPMVNRHQVEKQEALKLGWDAATKAKDEEIAALKRQIAEARAEAFEEAASILGKGPEWRDRYKELIEKAQAAREGK